MRFQLVASAVLAASLSVLVTATPVAEADWSYGDVLNHVVNRGGPDHPLVGLITRYVFPLLNSQLDMSTQQAGRWTRYINMTSEPGMAPR